MAFVNNYAPPPPRGPTVLPDPSKPYDINFCFPVKDLETDRVKPHLHAAALFNAIIANPEVMHYMPCSTPDTLEAFELFCEEAYRLDPSRCMFVILDKTKVAPGDETNVERGRAKEVSGFVGASGKHMPVIFAAPEQQNAWDSNQRVYSAGIGLFLLKEKVVNHSEPMTRWEYLAGTRQYWLFAGTTGRMEQRVIYKGLWIGRLEKCTVVMAFINNYLPPPPKAPGALPDPSMPYDMPNCTSWRAELIGRQPHLHATALFDAITAHPEVMRYMPYPNLATLEAFEMFCEETYRSDPSKCMCQWQAHASNIPSARAAERLGFKMEGVIRWQRPLPAERETSAPFRIDDSLGLPGRHTAMLAICWDDWENGGKDHLKRLMDRMA
ncbi:unnamed protein product [Rhizoctonia solani]|uniref:N-acetyltransferase domain-containing protein n=1 Tax=Rhizoctonia solani TaxID=456999 RepID=A0A8H3DVM6_9AGAM|nr:unnamed protein product [Rhizoctonia solani]